MKHLIIYLSVSLILFSCKKESAEIIEQNEITWNDTQKVRILKVEQTESPNSFPFDIDDLMTVRYEYSEGLLTEIIVHRSGVEYVYPVLKNSVDNRSIDVSKDTKKGFPNLPVFKGIEIFAEDKKILKSKNNYEISFFPPLPAQSIYRNISYMYEDNGLFKSAESVFGPIDEISIFNIKFEAEEYELGLLERYTLKKHQPIYPNTPMGQELNVKISYQASSDSPDGLIRLVNQAILGLPDIGFEDYLFHGAYDFLPNSGLLQWDQEGVYAELIAKYRYTFADWMVSFGLNDAFVIPNQGNHFIASKHITGRKMVDGELDDDGNIINPIYANVDSTANYPYTHNATNKTLEIAGLKIYYELVD
ncbi:MAG TPA: hypothetical protein VLZ75_08845 [Chitinophagales bacterium]|nr:hypothetical protein [Chitinophagales bacterium]